MRMIARLSSAHLGTLTYPFMLAAYPIVYLFTRNPGETGMMPLLWAVAASFGLCAAIWATSFALLQEAERSSVATAVIVGAFFSYGHLYAFSLDLLSRWTLNADPGRAEWNVQTTVLVLEVALVFLAFQAIRRAHQRTIGAWSLGLTVCAVTLTALVMGTAFVHRPATVASQRGVPDLLNQGPAGAGSLRMDYQPDIYEIVLDGYAREDILARHYNFDNKPFLNALEGYGFHVADRSSANFNWTFLSLASTLNMSYVTDLERDPGRLSTHRGRAYRMLRDNEVSRFLKARGYTTIHFDSTWAGTQENPFADVEVACTSGWFQDNFYRAIAESSLMRLWNGRIAQDIATCHLTQFLAVKRIASRAGPKAVFVHFIPPHHPYLFDRQGRILRNATVADQFEFNQNLWARRDLYREQLMYVNARILEVIGEIVARSDHPPIILLHSDHGPQLVDSQGNLESHHLPTRFANLLAVLAPNAPQLIPDDVTLVNLYRLVLNRYFNARLQILPDQYYSSPFERPYAFQQVNPFEDSLQ